MTSFLFPVVDLVGGARSKNDVAPFLSDVARATIDSADALVLFKNLIEGHGNEPESPGFMAFDAHGGEYVQAIFFLLPNSCSLRHRPEIPPAGGALYKGTRDIFLVYHNLLAVSYA